MGLPGAWKIKRYPFPSLPKLDDEFMSRLRLISEHCDKHRPETRWATDVRTRSLLRFSNKIQKSTRAITFRDMSILCAAVDDAHRLGLVHGDIIRRNVILSDAGPHLIDWEPCLRQYRHGKALLMGTYPYIHPADIHRGILSRDTDLMCIQLLICSLFEGRMVVRERALAQHVCNRPVNLIGHSASEILYRLEFLNTSQKSKQ